MLKPPMQTFSLQELDTPPPPVIQLGTRSSHSSPLRAHGRLPDPGHVWGQWGCQRLTWVAAQGLGVFAVAACKSLGALAHVTAALRVPADASVLAKGEKAGKGLRSSTWDPLGTISPLGDNLQAVTWQGWSWHVGQFDTPWACKSKSLKITSFPWITSCRTHPEREEGGC